MGDTTGWTISSNAITTKQAHGSLQPHSGTYFFSTSGEPASNAEMKQELDVSGSECTNLTLQGYYATDSSDKAYAKIHFKDSAGNIIHTQVVLNGGLSPAAWNEFKGTYTVPAGTVTAVIELSGSKGATGGQTDVHFDDFNYACGPFPMH